MPTVPPFHGNINFNAHHSPMGAFATFTCGHFGTGGGLGAQLGGPAKQDIFIGVKEGDRYAATPLKCLPFFDGAKGDAAAAFLVEQAAPQGQERPKIVSYGAAEIQRDYGWATDTWRTADFKFQICTPFGPLKDPAHSGFQEMRRCLLPAVIAELRVDNRHGTTPKTAFFALRFWPPGTRILDTGLRPGPWPRVGFAFGQQLGVAGELFDTTDNEYRPADAAPFVFMRWNPEEGLTNKSNPVHLLASCPGIAFEVPPGKCYSLDLALGVYLGGTVTTRLEGRYLYTRYYTNLVDVLNECLDRGYELWKASDALDKELVHSGLTPDQQFLLAHSVRSYYGSTQLLDVAGEPFWIVNEGEYCMLNTLDLSVDQVFWELRHNPWVVRNLLITFARHYAYHDQVKDLKTGELFPGGLSFCHDMGVYNNFSPFGHSSYEMTDLSGCFSYMTQEQLCNWILLAASYVAKTGDTEWVAQNAPLVHACFESMLNRDNPRAGGIDDQNGVMSFDSARCGTGQEITTYDSLDESLGQARRNLYLAVKCWAAYLGLAQLFECLPDPTIYPHEAELNTTTTSALEAAAKVATTVAHQLHAKEGFIPAVFEPSNPGYTSRILPAIEGLVYPLYWSTCDHNLKGSKGGGTQGWLSASGPFQNLLAALKQHTVTLLSDPARRNHFADGGLRLSSTSNNSWMSKIALVQQVCREVFGLDEHGQPLAGGQTAGGFPAADAAHVKWQTEGASAFWACSDQMVNGVAQGSKYYPRIVTTALWLKD